MKYKKPNEVLHYVERNMNGIPSFFEAEGNTNFCSTTDNYFRLANNDGCWQSALIQLYAKKALTHTMKL